MISVKEAVELATNFGDEIFKQQGHVEEVEIDGPYWLITLSYEVNKPETDDKSEKNPTNAFLYDYLESQKADKAYKLFKVNGETKQVVSAKIRQLQ